MSAARRPGDRARGPAPGSGSRPPCSWVSRSPLLVLLLAGVCAGCGSAGYLAHVSAGEIHLLLARERLSPERIARLSEQERHGLSLVQAARDRAEELGLRRSSSYRHLIDQDERFRVQVVVAAPANRLEPVTWWFPIVGRVAYRGYFDPGRAQRFAQELARQGLDTFVRSALLYSTLGWFDDPIPRALLRMDPVVIVNTILHELVHETVYVSGDTAYNEGLATFVAQHATLAFFAGQPERIRQARRRFADEQRFSRLLEDLAHELEALYRTTATPGEARRAREPEFRRYQEEVYPSLPWQTRAYEDFPHAILSNAYLLANRTYLGLLPCFEAELRGMHGDLEAFIRAHRERPGRHAADGPCPGDATP